MNIFVIRHGESDKTHNKNDWQFPLTEKGKSQAKFAGNFMDNFFTEHNLNLQNSIIIYSPYIRTRLTAEIIAKKLPLQIKPLINIIEYQKSKAITDCDEVVRYNEKLMQSITPLNLQNVDNLDPNESPLEIVLRAKLAIKYMSELNYENIILVTHNGFIRAFDIAFLDKPISDYFNEQKIRNCSIRHYEITNKNLYHGEILQKIKKEDLFENAKEC